MTSWPNRNLLWAHALMDELSRHGVTRVALSPGSRSAPLALAVHRLGPRLGATVHVDERSAAYWALGVARATGAAAAVVSTSGTAAANYLPAVVEAHEAGLPLIVLTADRPPELRRTGANQTIDQVKLYGDHVRLFLDVGLPEAADLPLRHLRQAAARAVAAAHGPPAGPAHLNLPFREPLDPSPVPGDVPPDLSSLARQGRPGGEPYTRIDRPEWVPEPDAVAATADLIQGAAAGLIVAGPRSLPDGAPYSLQALARTLGCPVMADPLSGVRFGAPDDVPVLAHYDAWLPAAAQDPQVRPDWILQFGATPTSKALHKWLADGPDIPRVVIDETGRHPDAAHGAARIVTSDADHFLHALSGRLVHPAPVDPAWRRRLNGLDAAAHKHLWQEPRWEATVPAQAAAALTEHDTLVVSSSLPIRDLDRYAPTGGPRLRVLANRGASGIDGVVSTAAGAAAATDGRTVLLIGDLALHHDLNGLASAARHAPNLTILVLNNGGGAIFGLLPIATYEPPFTDLFLTPHPLDLRALARAVGLPYHQAAEDADMARTLNEATHGVVEVVVDRPASWDRRRRLAAPGRTAAPRELL